MAASPSIPSLVKSTRPNGFPVAPNPFGRLHRLVLPTNLLKLPALRWIVTGVSLQLAGCASINDERYQTQRDLEPFPSVSAALSHMEAHETIHRRLRKSDWSSEGMVEEVLVTGIRSSLVPSITNNQEAGVDEGGIVKRIGDYVVILRQSKLYSVNMGNNDSETLTLIDEREVSPPSWKFGTWYDELLTYDNKVIVIGYSYDFDATIYAFFNLSDAGHITFQEAYTVPSSDYYDPENYSARLINGHMVLFLRGYGGTEDADAQLKPQAGKIDRNGKIDGPYELFEKNTVYRPIQFDSYLESVSVAVCPLNEKPLRCTAQTIIGSEFPVFYVSPDYAYVWGSSSYWGIDVETVPYRAFDLAYSNYGYDNTDQEVEMLYRIPLWSGDVNAVQLKGLPEDQFSFSQQGDTLYIATLENSPNSDRQLTAYWIRLTPEDFSKSANAIAVFHKDESNFRVIDYAFGWDTNNRFIGEQLVLTTNSNSYGSGSTIFAVDLNTDKVERLTVDSQVDQIHPIGTNVLLLSTDDDAAKFVSVDLSSHLSIQHELTLATTELAESRSHGFFYAQLKDTGIAAIPIVYSSVEDEHEKRDGVFYEALPTTDMLYLGIDKSLALEEAGRLNGDKAVQWVNEDDCEMPCIDWYGTARPFFIGDRVFALLKNELVEGYVSGGRVHERRRVTLAN